MDTLHEIKCAYRDNQYSINWSDYATTKVPEGHIFDEEQSVRWNREQVKIHNAHVAEEYKRRSRDQRALDTKLRDDCIGVIMQEFHLTDDQACKVYDFCYDKWHSDMDDFFDYLFDIGNLFAEIMEDKNK